MIMKNCGNCAYCDLLITEEPCMDCKYNENWEPKTCHNCKYSDISLNCKPCSDCLMKDLWEPKEDDDDRRRNDQESK